jgi:hypothetical protein
MDGIYPYAVSGLSSSLRKKIAKSSQGKRYSAINRIVRLASGKQD